MSITSATYNQTQTQIIVVTDEGTLFVPIDETNRHYQEIQNWVKEGNTIKYYIYTPTNDDINAERARRILAGATFNGIWVTGSSDDARNLTNLALAAQVAIATNTTTTFVFRDGNNIEHELTPVQMLGLWQQSASFVSNLYEKSWALKEMTPIPTDYVLDTYWL